MNLQLREKDAHINSLTHLINNINKECKNTPNDEKRNHKLSAEENTTTSDYYSWNVVKRKNAFTTYPSRNIPLSNKFNGLQMMKILIRIIIAYMMMMLIYKLHRR